MTCCTIFGVIARRTAWPWRILLEAFEARVEKALPPTSGLLRRDAQLIGDLDILFAVGGQQNDARALHDAGWKRTRTGLLFQDRLIFGRENNGARNPHPASASYCRNTCASIKSLLKKHYTRTESVAAPAA